MKRVIAIVGKAGSGKNTIVDQVVKTYPDKFNKIISCTTRPPRENEKDGVDYHFVSKDYFFKKIYNKEVMEYTSFNNWQYGTMIDSYLDDKINIGIFNPEGVRTLLSIPEINLNLKVIYIKCSDKIRLIRQLNRELEPNIEEIIRRYKTDQIDFEIFEYNFFNTPHFNFMAIENESRDMIPKIVDIINNL